MNKHDFYYELPPELIAQYPLERRDSSRLLMLDRETGSIEHKTFVDFPSVLMPGDCLVLNDSRVIPARLYGKRESGGAVELLLISDKGGGVWECLAKPGRKVRPGIKLIFGDEDCVLEAMVLDTLSDGNKMISFCCDGVFLEVLEKLGKTPLPPYIKAELKDGERYQTVYAKFPGSAAAPTAGLHFSNELIEQIKNKGVNVCHLTLHVGLGTFRPVKEDDVLNHKMHSEFFSIQPETAAIINKVKQENRRVIACGTTSCRALESAAKSNGMIQETEGFTDIFIYPGYKFKCADGLLTNFHLPESTLIMLVSAFAGHRSIMNAYEEAVRLRYRFFSFGDAMLIV